MLKKVGIGLGALVIVLLVVIGTRPSEYKIERSIVISAPAETVWTEVSDFRRWDAWSPWEKIDPEMKKTYEGEPGVVGSKYSWEGNDAGKGTMTITAAERPHKIVEKLEFFEPWPSVATTTHTITPEDGGVKVTWSMEGEHDFLGKAMCLVIDMDAALGAEYEKGLQALKTVAEENAKQVAAAGAGLPDAAVDDDADDEAAADDAEGDDTLDADSPDDDLED